MEALEARIAPAGIIQVFLRDGDLVLVGDSADHEVSLTGGADGGIVITPGTDTQLELGNSPPTSAPVNIQVAVQDLRIRLGAGDDTVELDDLHTLRNVSVALGRGDNALSVTASDVLGALRVNGRGDSNRLTLDGRDQTTFIGSDFAVHFSPGINSVAATGNELRIAGDFTYRGGGGFSDVNLQLGSLSIGGAFKARAGRSGISLTVGAEKNASIGGLVSVMAHDRGDNGTLMEFDAQGRFDFGGAVRLVGQSGGDTLAFMGGDFTFAGGLTAEVGAGPNSFQIQTVNLAMAGTLALGSTSDLTVDFNVSNRLVLNGDFAVHTGAGNEQIDIVAPGVVRGKVIMDVGTGGDNVTFRGDTAVGRLVLAGGLSVVQSGLFANAAVILQHVTLDGPSRIITGSTDDVLSLEAVLINAPLTIDLGAGGDTADLGGLTESTMEVNAPVTLRMRTGDDAVSIGAVVTSFEVNARFTLAGGAGQDSLDYLTHGNTFNVPPVVRGFETIT